MLFRAEVRCFFILTGKMLKCKLLTLCDFREQGFSVDKKAAFKSKTQVLLDTWWLQPFLRRNTGLAPASQFYPVA